MTSRTLHPTFTLAWICIIAFTSQQCKRRDRTQADKSTITIMYPGNERLMNPVQEGEPMFMVFLPFAKDDEYGELEGWFATSWEHS